LRRHLEPSYRNIKPQIVQYYSIQPLLAKCGQMLSCLAYWGTDDVAEANKAFQSGIQRLKTDEPPGISPLESCGLTALDGSLNMLAAAAAPLKKLIIEACTACIGADGRVTLEEAELLRAIADSLDCPIPPFIAA